MVELLVHSDKTSISHTIILFWHLPNKDRNSIVAAESNALQVQLEHNSYLAQEKPIAIDSIECV